MMEHAAGALGALGGGETADGRIAGLIPLFAGRTVLVLGDVMLDRYVSGEVSRISPEAPIPVLRVTAARASLGGAAVTRSTGIGASGEIRLTSPDTYRSSITSPRTSTVRPTKSEIRPAIVPSVISPPGKAPAACSIIDPELRLLRPD